MSVRSWSYPLMLSIGALFVGALAPEAQAAGDAAKGRILSETCLGCHAIENYKNTYPMYRAPKLRGQHPEYIVIALKAYRSGERSHGTMHAQASSFTDQEMEDVAAFLAGEAITPGAGGAQPVGTAPAAAATCQACHGRDGVGIMGIYPTLTGQHADYLEQSLRQYRNGQRRNAIMQPFATQLTEEDIPAIAAYFANQKPGLKTVPRTNSSWFGKQAAR
jgi:cytochrome c553